MKKFFLLTVLAAFAVLAKAQPDYVTLDPENGSTVSSLKKVMFTFDQSQVSDIYANNMQGAKFPVLDASGKQVAGAYFCEADQQNLVVVLKIQPSIYDAGTYSVNVPSNALQIFDMIDQRIAHEDWPLSFTVDGTETAPVIDAHFIPEPNTTVDYLAQLTFTADGYSTYLYDNASPDKIQVVDADGNVVTTGTPDITYNTEDAHGIINLQQAIYDDGDYMVQIPGTIFRLGFDWQTCYQGEYDMLPEQQLIYTVHNTHSTKYDVDYGHTSCVREINLTFTDHQSVALDPSVLSYDIRNSEGYWRGYTCTWDNLITADGNKLNVKFASGIAEPDTYTIFIPAGDLIFEDGTTNTPMTVNFTVSEAEQTKVESVPAAGSEVNEVYSMTLTFPESDAVSEYFSSASIPLFTEQGDTLTNDNGDYYLFEISKVSGNTAKLQLLCGDDYVTLTTPGSYHVSVPYGCFYLNSDKTEVSSEITIPFTLVKNDDSHTYYNWGYYAGDDDITYLGAIGADKNFYRVAIYLPGDGLLQNAQLAGARIPVRSGIYVSDLKAWVATDLRNDNTYSHETTLDSAHDGFNTVRFDENITIPAGGLYLGYDITIDEAYADYGAYYAVVIDEETKVANSLWLSIPGYSWYDYGETYGCSPLQGIFADLDLSRPAAQFGSINDASTQAGATSDWKFPITVTNSETVTQIEYTIDVAGVKTTRTAVANIPSGVNQKGYITVSITAPQESGEYSVGLTANKINGKENIQPTTTVSVFGNVAYSVTRHTVVEEMTGTGCGWCPRGMIGLKKLNEAYGDKVICLASHQYNTNDPMYLPYIDFSAYGVNGAPNCLIDRKTSADPYAGINGNGDIVEDVQKYLNIPAVADVKLQARWVDTSCSAVQIDCSVEAFSPDTYEVAYVLSADNIGLESKKWSQSNYYADLDASDYPEDLAPLCSGGEYGSSTFLQPYNDVVIASSYTDFANVSGAKWTMADGQTQQHSYQLELPVGDLGTAVSEQLDKVYAVAIVINSKGEVAQAAKVNVNEFIPEGIDEVNDNDDDNDDYYNVAGQRVNKTAKGIVITNGKKVLR